MGNWLLNLFTGGLFGEVKDGLLQAQRNHLESKTQESEQNLKFWQSRMDLAIAASQHDKFWSPRNLMGWAVAIYILKIVVWDSTFQLGSTPYPGEQVTFIVMTVVGFYFASKAAENIATIIAGRTR
jgi:hypothetical protein